ncbi:MAG: nitroreductase, partial [Desulfohalobiaceae bacterium]
ELMQAIPNRRSIRGFKPDPVPKGKLLALLQAAVRAPSAMNSQPWKFTVLAGNPLQELQKKSSEKFRAGEDPAPELAPGNWPRDSVYRKRQTELAKEIFKLLDIGRENREKRLSWAEKGIRFFDAPAAILVCTDRQLPECEPLLDIGAAVQNICLAAVEQGLGTCIEVQGVGYPKLIREITGIGLEKRIILGIAVGWPDWEAPANQLYSSREDPEALTTWIGF